MIYLNPTGGLGNNLFQIAALYGLALDNDDELCLLNTEKHINDLNNDERATAKNGEKYNFIFNKFHKLDNVKPIWSPNQKYSSPTVDNFFNKVHYPFQYKSLEYQDQYEYIGNFQSEKYFKHRRNEILELFKPNDEFLVEINKYSHLFGNIGLHVRRGDYVGLHAGRMIELGMEYYNKGLSELPNDIPILVFSDDLEWCKDNFIDDKFIFIDEPDYISLYLMGKMKFFIIANSSYSWWGAWLGNPEKVFAPKEWFANGVRHKHFEYDIIPENWIKI